MDTELEKMLEAVLVDEVSEDDEDGDPSCSVPLIDSDRVQILEIKKTAGLLHQDFFAVKIEEKMDFV